MNFNYARPYFNSFMVALIITLLPSKMLGYVAPFVALFWFLIDSKSGQTVYRIILFFIAFSVLVAFYFYIYHLNDVHFLVANAFVAICTYSTFVTLLVIPGNKLTDRKFHYARYASVMKYVILIEGLTGIFQYFIVSLTGRFNIISGDAVQGTIGLTAFIEEKAGFGNQMFSINMAFFLMLFIPHVLVHRKEYYVLAIGLFSLLLAGVLHVFIGLLVAIVITILFYRRNILLSDIHKILFFTAVAGLLLIPIRILIPGIAHSANIYLKLYQGGNSPKIEAINTALYRLPVQYPLVYWIGLGPGQYSSRAGLISSGNYFSEKVSFLPNQVSKPFQEYVSRTWKIYKSNTEGFGNSTMHRPFFSLLSVFTEFGAIGFGVFMGIIIYYFIKLRTLFFYFKTKNTIYYYLCFCLAVMIVTIVNISFFENYLETTQAVLPSLMLFKVLYSQLSDEYKQKRVAPTRSEVLVST